MTEPEPPRGVPLRLRPGIARVVAPNPGPMTYHGTNTWLIETPSGLVVIDPGPDDTTHLAAVCQAIAARPVAAILLTHHHRDHAGALPALRSALNAPAFAFEHEAADHRLGDGDRIAGITALHTPGHASDHLCFAASDGAGEAVLFSGDHVMGWSTTVVAPPDGDMAAYLASLRRLLDTPAAVLLPGHGPPVERPREFVAALIEHRMLREAMLLDAIRQTPADLPTLTAQLYPGLEPRLQPAASRTLLAHALKLAAEGRVRERDAVWEACR